MQPVTRFIPCRECGGTGRVETSRYGGNDMIFSEMRGCPCMWPSI